ncbi:MAG: rhodanese-like domain-containing protein [Catalinimonas sp.]
MRSLRLLFPLLCWLCTTACAQTATDLGPDAFEAALPLPAERTQVLIDVRTPAEYAEGHLPGARLMNVYDDDFEERLGALDRDRTYYVYCKSGVRSGKAADRMVALGFRRVVGLDGGYRAWQRAGKPVERK